MKIGNHYTIIPTITLFFETLNVRVNFAFYKYIFTWNIRRKCPECNSVDGEIYPDYKAPYEKLNYYCETCDKLIREATEQEEEEFQAHIRGED